MFPHKQVSQWAWELVEGIMLDSGGLIEVSSRTPTARHTHAHTHIYMCVLGWFFVVRSCFGSGYSSIWFVRRCDLLTLCLIV